MDLCLENGQHKKGLDGKPSTVSDLEELIQRVLIRLSVRQGSFPYDTALGCQFYRLKDSGNESLDHEAFAYACEALAPMKAVVVSGVSCKKTAIDSLYINVYMSINNTSHSLEVTV